MSSFINIVGRRFGRLIAIKTNSTSKNGDVLWLCKCDCGNEKIIRCSSLTSGKTKSCGCLHKEIVKKNMVKIGRLCVHDTIEKAFLSHIIRQYNRQAKRRNYEFNISDEKFVELISDKCYYCGSFKYSNSVKIRDKMFYYNGIDRIDNTKGYVNNNVVSCCKICNQAKRDLTLKEFNEWRQQMVNHVNKNGL